MNLKKNLVILEAGNLKQAFEVSHAERILSMDRNGGWRLPTDSEFEMTNDGIRYKSNKKEAQTPKKATTDK